MKRLLSVVIGIHLLALATGSPAQTLRWASQGDPQTMDPDSQNELLTNAINGQVYESLAARDKQMNVVPALATEWVQQGAMTWRMKLRPNVKFHEGSVMTADDVVFSLQRAKEPTSGIRAYAVAMGEVRKVDDLTVEFKLPQVDRKSTRLNSSHLRLSRMPSSA